MNPVPVCLRLNSRLLEEKDLLDSYERGEWESVKNLEEEIKNIEDTLVRL